MKKIAMLGSTLPWRGGVARHTTHLHRELVKRGPTRTIGFQRQYPAWLFPGRFQHEPGYEGWSEPGIEYTIDSLAPRTWRTARQQLLDFAPERVLVPWWTVYWAPVYSAILPALRKQGAQIHFLCHNVVEHESNVARRWLTRRLLSLGDQLTAQAPAEAERLRGWFPHAHVQTLPHPPFPAAVARAPIARKAAIEILFFGLVRPYKGIETLLAALQAMPTADIHLTVVGEWWKSMGRVRETLASARLPHPITIVDRYVSEDEAANYFALADAVVLPYLEATGSGVIGLAHSYGKPVIASEVGGLPAQVRNGENGLLVPPRDSAALARAIQTIPRLPRNAAPHVPDWAAYLESLLALA